MLIDEVTIEVRAGSGGRGAVAFNKNLMSLGPAGGSGGSGGSVFFEGVSDLGALRRFRFVKKVHAMDGQNGKPQFNDGHAGKDIVVPVPVGTVVHENTGGTMFEITKIGERVVVARGGRGGRGNFHFRSSTNTSPREFEEGTAGEMRTLTLELKLIADVGLIGLPNAGKTSLLNALTRASAKVANYPFTTLEPNLGVYGDLVLADIPGLIEGASTGRGLGVRFLRHIERTRVLIHLVAVDNDDPVRAYETVRAELAAHGHGLEKKEEFIFLSKCDLIESGGIEQMKKKFADRGLRAAFLSLEADKGLHDVRGALEKVSDAKHATS